MKPGDRVIWLYSRKRSFVVGCGVQRIPGEVIRVCKRRVKLRVKLPDREKLVNVSPENVLFNEDDLKGSDCLFLQRLFVKVRLGKERAAEGNG